MQRTPMQRTPSCAAGRDSSDGRGSGLQHSAAHPTLAGTFGCCTTGAHQHGANTLPLPPSPPPHSPHAGGRAFFYPKHVWTPAGGWWNLAPNGWQRNTAIAFGCIGTVAYGVFTVSASKEVRGGGREGGAGVGGR